MSVYLRGEVYWYEFVFQRQRIREATGLTNKIAARRAEAIRKAELAEGRAGIVRREPCPVFEAFVKDEFLPWSKRQHEAKPRTHQRYEVAVKQLNPFFGKFSLDLITSGHIEKFKLKRAAEVSSAGTNRELAMLRFMLNFAVRQGDIVRNPVCGIRFLPEGPGKMRVVSHEEEEKYLNAASALLKDIATLTARV